MINTRHNPVLEARLQAFLQRGDAEGLLQCLENLSNADFRTSGGLLRERLLLQLSGEEFWRFFAAIVPRNPRAYLGTFLRAAEVLYVHGNLTFDSPQLDEFAALATEIDKRKILASLLPRIKTQVADAERLFSLFQPASQGDAIGVLLPVPTKVAAYLLFQLLRRMDHEPALLRDVCISLMKRGDATAFSLASLIKAYFGLPALPGTFSLRIQPFQLSHVEGNYEAFSRLLS